MEFRGKDKRRVCYAARDEYFVCLDKNSEDCRKQYDSFEAACGLKWTEHFIRKRDYEKFKTRLETDGLTEEDMKVLSKASTKPKPKQ